MHRSQLLRLRRLLRLLRLLQRMLHHKEKQIQ
jgi:hypothetical protein